MTRFEQEITGKLGEWWQQHAQKEIEYKVKQANEDAIVESSGAIRWKSGNYLMDDYCEVLEYVQYPFSREATREARDLQVQEQLANYHHEYSEEELFEMRAAFGEGAKVINVLSGKEIQL